MLHILVMSLTSAYINYDEQRTVGLGPAPVKSIQAWKTPQNPIKTEEKQTHFSETLEGEIQNYTPTASDTSARTTSSQNKFKFSDVIDVINPLHHIPIIGSLYRHFTEDELHPMSAIIGGAVYGGPAGAVSGTVNAVSQLQTGKDIGEHGLRLIGLQQEQDTINQPVPLNNIEAYNAHSPQSTGQSLQDKINELRQNGMTITAINEKKT